PRHLVSHVEQKATKKPREPDTASYHARPRRSCDTVTRQAETRLDKQVVERNVRNHDHDTKHQADACVFEPSIPIVEGLHPHKHGHRKKTYRHVGMHLMKHSGLVSSERETWL